MKILAAIDDSHFSETAIDGISQYFKPQSIEIRVLHVLTPIVLSDIPQMSRGYAPELEDEAKAARALVEKHAARLRAEGYAAEAAVETGDVREEILDAAADWHADLILLGCHGHKGMTRLLLGSVAESVIRHATCSVLVVRPTAS